MDEIITRLDRIEKKLDRLIMYVSAATRIVDTEHFDMDEDGVRCAHCRALADWDGHGWRCPECDVDHGIHSSFMDLVGGKLKDYYKKIKDN